jgi:serine transporter
LAPAPVFADQRGRGRLLAVADPGAAGLPDDLLAHRGLTRFVLSGREGATSPKWSKSTSASGRRADHPAVFFAIFPILLIYSVALTNTVGSFLEHQLHIMPPPRAILSLVLILGLLAVVRCGEQVIVKAMSLMVYPFIVALLFLAVYLIPHWNGGILTTASTLPSPRRCCTPCGWRFR